MSSELSLRLDETAPSLVVPGAKRPRARRRSLGASLSLTWEVIKGGFVELWAHKLRSILTLTLLMLGVFALVVMTAVLDGVMDKISTGFAGMAWDGTLMIAPNNPETGEEQKRFAMSPGLRYEDLARLTVPSEKVLFFIPRAMKRSTVRVAGGAERTFVIGVTHEYAKAMNRPIGLGRGITEDDERRRSAVAVVGATLGAKLFGGSDPVGRDIVVEGVPFRVVGVQAAGQLFSDENYYDANGILVPLVTYMDRIDSEHKLAQVAVKLARKRDMGEVSAMMLGRVRQAHHGIEDVEVTDLDAEGAKEWENFLDQMRGWRIVLTSLAATVLFVGGVGVLSVMLISFSDRRFEIGLRKAMGASDGEIFTQFLLEATVLAAVGAFVGTVAGAALCNALSPMFPYGLTVNPVGLLVAWGTAIVLALGFGMYPAVRASRLSPMEAMR
jgi:putative ABC transport system permease protein